MARSWVTTKAAMLESGWAPQSSVEETSTASAWSALASGAETATLLESASAAALAATSAATSAATLAATSETALAAPMVVGCTLYNPED